MTILYEYMAGDAPCLWFAIISWVLAAIFLGFMIYGMHDGEEGLSCCCAVLLVFCIIFGFVMNSDQRRPAVQALVDDTASWVEINDQYEFVKKEGEIYTFYVREDAANE